jgi:hypothetical protein
MLARMALQQEQVTTLDVLMGLAHQELGGRRSREYG